MLDSIYLENERERQKLAGDFPIPGTDAALAKSTGRTNAQTDTSCVAPMYSGKKST